MSANTPLWVSPQRPIRTFEAADLGVTRGELAGPRWRTPLRGVQLPVGSDPDSPTQRIYEVASLLPPGAAIGGWAAGHLLGAWELDGRGATRQDRWPVPVVLPPPVVIRARPALVRWRSTLDDEDVTMADGIPCCTAVRAAFDHARRTSLREGVVGLDVFGRRLGVSPADVLAYAEKHRRWQGLPLLRRGAALADPRALSPGETRLRLMWVLDAGLPVPEVNPDVFGLDGGFLGMVDLLDPEAGFIGEYDGAYHRDAQQHAHDNAREEWLEDTVLTVVRAGGHDLGPFRIRTVRRLQTGHARGRRRDRARDRWTWRQRPQP